MGECFLMMRGSFIAQAACIVSTNRFMVVPFIAVHSAFLHPQKSVTGKVRESLRGGWREVGWKKPHAKSAKIAKAEHEQLFGSTPDHHLVTFLMRGSRFSSRPLRPLREAELVS